MYAGGVYGSLCGLERAAGGGGARTVGADTDGVHVPAAAILEECAETGGRDAFSVGQPGGGAGGDLQTDREPGGGDGAVPEGQRGPRVNVTWATEYTCVAEANGEVMQRPRGLYKQQ